MSEKHKRWKRMNEEHAAAPGPTAAEVRAELESFTIADLESRARVGETWGIEGARDVVAGAATRWAGDVRSGHDETRDGLMVIYLAHPVSGDIENNLASARRWVRLIEEARPDVAVVASWITECEIWDDNNPEHRAAGLRRDLAVLARCDELWLVGPRISAGMRAEEEAALSLGMCVHDFTGLRGGEPGA